MVYSVSRMKATGLSQPALIAVTKILLYSAGQLLLISNPARDTIWMPSGENVKSASPGRRVLTECPVVLIMLYYSMSEFIGQLVFDKPELVAFCASF